uniref:Single domain-containing protein n=1 Tax=Anopheles atroparvus TaxID=41427 RepID=A0AAG5DMT6_ANOAO
MLLVRVGAVLLWLGSAFWLSCDGLKRNPQDTRRISDASYSVYKGRCYDYRTGIVLPRNGVPKKLKHLCMRATCFRNYTMLVESCRKTTCVVPNVKYTKNYPHCCPEVICKNGNQVRYLLSNETVTSIPTRRPVRRGKRVQQKKGKKGARKIRPTSQQGRKAAIGNVGSTTEHVSEHELGN